MMVSDWEKLFWDGESILHLKWQDNTEMRKTGTLKESITRPDMFLVSLRFMVLSMALSGLYGGVHLTIWGQSFPSYMEEVMWKVSCLLIICCIPFVVISALFTFPLAGVLEDKREYQGKKSLYNIISGSFFALMFPIGLGYIAARVFIIVESFLSLRRSPVGVFLSPEWVELFPYF